MIIGPGPGPEPPEEAFRALARPTVGSAVAPVLGGELAVSDGRVDAVAEGAEDDVVVDGLVVAGCPEATAADPCAAWACVAAFVVPRPPPPPPPPVPPDPPVGTVVEVGGVVEVGTVVEVGGVDEPQIELYSGAVRGAGSPGLPEPGFSKCQPSTSAVPTVPLAPEDA